MTKRQISLIALTLFVAFLPVDFTFARELNETEQSNLLYNCATIKTRLQNIQKNDSRNRVKLGSYYEMLNTSLMLNLNLRLIKNNLANSELSDQQTKFSTSRENFKTQFTNYQHALNDLVNADCNANPQAFYNRIEQVRTERAELNLQIVELHQILRDHRNSVLTLKESL